MESECGRRFPEGRQRAEKKLRLGEAHSPRLDFEPAVPADGRALEASRFLRSDDEQQRERVAQGQAAQLASSRLGREEIAPLHGTPKAPMR